MLRRYGITIFGVNIVIKYQKISFDNLICKLSPLETICMKCQSLSLWKKNMENIISISSAEFFWKVEKDNTRSERSFPNLTFIQTLCFATITWP